MGFRKTLSMVLVATTCCPAALWGDPVYSGEPPPDEYAAGPGIPTPCGTLDWEWVASRFGIQQPFVFTRDEILREDYDGQIRNNVWNGNPNLTCTEIRLFSTDKKRIGPDKFQRTDKTIVTVNTSTGVEVGGTIHNAVSFKLSFGKSWSQTRETTDVYDVDIGEEIAVPPCWQAAWHGYKRTHYVEGYLAICDEFDYKATCFGGTVYYTHKVERERLTGTGEKLVERVGTVEWNKLREECTVPHCD